MSTHRGKNYENIRRTILLDREEVLLRKERAKTREDVQRLWDARYPHARPESRELITTELNRRLKFPLDVV